MRSGFVLAVLFSFVPLSFAAADADRDAKPQPGRMQSMQLDVPIQIRVRLRYLLYLPPDYAAKEKWPMLLFLHGAGETGSDLELVKKHGPPKLIAAGKQFPFVVVCPQAPRLGWRSEELKALIDHVMDEYRIDPDRVYVTGLSMGGYGTWALAIAYPDLFAAIVPICGGGDAKAVRRIRHVPTWAFHGGKDRVVPARRSKVMIEALKAAGNPVARLTIYPDAGHDSWTATYDNPELYTWLLKQKRRCTFWSGEWKGAETGHGGDLKCAAHQIGPERWVATFSGHCGRDYAFQVDLVGKKEGDRVVFKGEVDLGKENGGKYRWTGHIAGDRFVGRYETEAGKRGQFQLRRVTGE